MSFGATELLTSPWLGAGRKWQALPNASARCRTKSRCRMSLLFKPCWRGNSRTQTVRIAPRCNQQDRMIGCLAPALIPFPCSIDRYTARVCDKTANDEANRLRGEFIEDSDESWGSWISITFQSVMVNFIPRASHQIGNCWELPDGQQAKTCRQRQQSHDLRHQGSTLQTRRWDQLPSRGHQDRVHRHLQQVR